MISCTHQSPVGVLTLHSNGVALIGLAFETQRYPLPAHPPGEDKVLSLARRELDRYFAGALTTFSVATAPQGTPFQQKVWAALLTIPYGATRSYGEQAAAIGAPKAVRAVGSANGKNPISIIIPCHRVIGAAGALTGFGGGLERKRALLDLERGQVRRR
jgi:methylated-DNA-[protein]-cysteine S-methyltransferase